METLSPPDANFSGQNRRSKNPSRPKPGWKPIFLETLANTGNVRAACTAADINRNTAYQTKERSPEFAKQWDEACETATDLLEYVAWQRATTTSDLLLIFLMKANRPGKYRETKNLEISGPQGGPIQQQLLDVSDEERASRLAALFDRARTRRLGSSPDDGSGDAKTDGATDTDGDA